MKERSRVAYFRSVVWKLTEMRRSGAVKQYDPYVKKKKKKKKKNKKNRYKYSEM
jgi:hypothetical protein